MKDVLLQGSLGHSQIDTVVLKVIQMYENAFPEQIAAYYIEGSYADQTYLLTSDIDLVIIFHNRFAHEDTRQAAEQLWESNHRGATEVDITVLDEYSLQEGVHPGLKLSGRLIYGQDVCSAYPILPMEAWARDRMYAAYWLLINVYQRPTPVYLPLSYPSLADEFYGYTNRTLQLPDGQEVPCTRNLVRTTGWAATALLALRARQYAGRKRECSLLYRTYIGDEWSSLLEDIATFCRDKWQYLVPTESHERELLREICERTLYFEQHFLTFYKSYLLEQLHSTKQEHVHLALRLQENSQLCDGEVTAVVQTLKL